jgi:hypothetical protein
MSRYGNLLTDLREQLQGIEPSTDESCTCVEYFPCAVMLKDGRRDNRVYLASAEPWFRKWGVWPEDDPGKSLIRIEDIVSIAESPSRLPAKFANELYRAGESGMGYTVFTVEFSGLIKSHRTYLTGNAVDFIEYPWRKGPKDVIGVLPHVGRDARPRNGPRYSWCLFSD